jgi:hypothetical protein
MRGDVRRAVLLLIGLAVVTLVLVGSVFLTGRLLPGDGRQDKDMVIPGVGVVQKKGPEVLAVQAEELPVERASELPTRKPDVAGVFAYREENRISVTDTRDGVIFLLSETGSVSTIADGPVTQVVVTDDTVLYVDATLEGFDGLPPGGLLQQELIPGSLEEMGQASTIEAWGERRGEIVVAKVVLYTRPPLSHQ